MHLPRDLQTEKRLKELEDDANVILDKTIVYTEEPLKVHWFQETKLMTKFTEKLLEWTNADIAMLNAGLLLDELPAGTITYTDVHRICQIGRASCRERVYIEVEAESLKYNILCK